MMWTAVALDPGGTTGIAACSVDLDDVRTEGISALVDSLRVEEVAMQGKSWLAEIRAGHRVWDRMDELSFEMGIGWDRIVCESFFLYPGRQHTSNRSGILPARIESVVMSRLVDEWSEASEESLREFVLWQSKSESNAVSNDALKENGLWTVGKPHGRDATRHLALAAMKAIQ